MYTTRHFKIESYHMGNYAGIARFPPWFELNRLGQLRHKTRFRVAYNFHIYRSKQRFI